VVLQLAWLLLIHGVGYPKNWEDQEQWNGGWELVKGELRLKSGQRSSILRNIFMNPNMPTIDAFMLFLRLVCASVLCLMYTFAENQGNGALAK
jgi:hypothetical protein